jgi:hypothetical protein
LTTGFVVLDVAEDELLAALDGALDDVAELVAEDVAAELVELGLPGEAAFP